MATFNYYTFSNIQSPSQFFDNLVSVANLNGWTIDKYVSGDEGELYLHSLGNGNQKLYYSFQWVYAGNNSYVVNGSNLYDIRLYSNLGFDSSLTVNNQPGVWSSISSYNTPVKMQPIQFPVNKQYIFVNSSCLMVFSDYTLFANLFTTITSTTFSSQRIINHIVIGSIDSYLGNSETFGNLHIISGQTFNVNNNVYYTSGLGGNPMSSPYYTLATDSFKFVFSIYYLNETKFSGYYTKLLGLSSTCYAYVLGSYKSAFKGGDYYPPNTYYGFNYDKALTFNSYTNKAVLLKPIISIKHTIAGYNYFFPIGELPYYLSVHNPYFIAGQEIYYGTRKFIAMPLLYYDCNYGVMIEVN